MVYHTGGLWELPPQIQDGGQHLKDPSRNLLLDLSSSYFPHGILLSHVTSQREMSGPSGSITPCSLTSILYFPRITPLVCFDVVTC